MSSHMEYIYSWFLISNPWEEKDRCETFGATPYIQVSSQSKCSQMFQRILCYLLPSSASAKGEEEETKKEKRQVGGRKHKGL